jgi:hypothetical protein
MTDVSCFSARSLARSPFGRRLFSRMLWQAFPSHSEHEVAEKAAPILGLSERHVRRLLQCDHSAKIEHFLAVAAIVGFEAVLSMVNEK